MVRSKNLRLGDYMENKLEKCANQLMESGDYKGVLLIGNLEDDLHIQGRGMFPLFAGATLVFSEALKRVPKEEREALANTVKAIALQRVEEDESNSKSDETTDSEE